MTDLLSQLDSCDLRKAGVEFTEQECPWIAGMGGCAVIVRYHSSKLNKGVAVMVLPQRPEIDVYAERYFYFDAAEFPSNEDRDGITSAYDSAVR